MQPQRVWPLCPPKATLRLPELHEETLGGSALVTNSLAVCFKNFVIHSTKRKFTWNLFTNQV